MIELSYSQQKQLNTIQLQELSFTLIPYLRMFYARGLVAVVLVVLVVLIDV